MTSKPTQRPTQIACPAPWFDAASYLVNGDPWWIVLCISHAWVLQQRRSDELDSYLLSTTALLQQGLPTSSYLGGSP
eukprot:915765-Amphidinium_carterae.1